MFECHTNVFTFPAAGKISAEECDKSGISKTSVHGAEQVSLFSSALPYAALRHLLFVHGSVRPFMHLFLYPARRISSVQTYEPEKLTVQLSLEGKWKNLSYQTGQMNT